MFIKRRLFSLLLFYTIVFVGLFKGWTYVSVKLGKLDLQEKFDKLQTEYIETLSKLPVPIYKDSDVFIQYGPPVSELGLRKNSTGGSSNTKTILTWTTFFGQVQWMPKTITCQGTDISCVVTTDKKDLLKSDAVVFHPIDLKSYPQQRLPHQRWVYLVQEPPYMVRAMSGRTFDTYNGIFNWTSTYRWDSDFPAIFYNATTLEKPLADKDYQKIIESIRMKKTKLLAIMHRNCKPQSPRFKILAELRRYLPVDFYGSCGNLSCPRNTKECDEKMSAYKFYLSFENSECRDYITEKVFQPLNWWQAVPVILGAHPRDCAKILPPNSYIHVKGFSSIKKLAEYIRFLDKNPEFYEKYHSWRRTHSDQVHYKTYCELCKSLFDQSLPVKSYTDLKGWYEEDICWPYVGNKR